MDDAYVLVGCHWLYDVEATNIRYNTYSFWHNDKRLKPAKLKEYDRKFMNWLFSRAPSRPLTGIFVI